MRSSLYSSRIEDKSLQKSMRSWRRTSIICLRLAFGMLWTWNTLLLAWQLTAHTASMYVKQAITASQTAGLPMPSWSAFWQQAATGHPTSFLFICTVGMGLVACGLCFGIFTNLTCCSGGALALFFWSTGLIKLLPVGVQANDIGILLVFLLAFLGFAISGAGQIWGLDYFLAEKLGRWAFLAGGKARLRPAPTYQQAPWRQVEFPIEFPSEAPKASNLEHRRTVNHNRKQQIPTKEAVGGPMKRVIPR